MENAKRYSFRLYEPRDHELIEWLDKNDFPKGSKNTIIRLALLAAMNNSNAIVENKRAIDSKVYSTKAEEENTYKDVESFTEVDPEAEEASAKLMSLFG